MTILWYAISCLEVNKCPVSYTLSNN